MGKRTRTDLTRRTVLAGAAAGGAGLAFGAGPRLVTPRQAQAQTEPRRGGHLRMGVGSGSAADVIDPTQLMSEGPIVVSFQMRNCLVEIDSNGDAIGELAESWDVAPNGRDWVFNIRRGVEFHSGKTLTVDDVIFSLNLHRGEQSTSAAKAILASVTDIRKHSENQMLVSLSSPNVDFLYVLSDYHLQIVPDGTVDFSRGDGTGAYVLDSWEPGVRSLTVRNPNYWRSDRGFVDSVETVVINDATSRTNALMAGAVDLISGVDSTTAGLLEQAPGVELLLSPSGRHIVYAMNTTTSPFDNLDLRLALKHAVNRQQMVDIVLRGYGRVGNDHPVPPSSRFWDSGLEQRVYDPDRARFHAERAGYDGAPIELHIADTLFPGTVESGILYQESASQAGLNLTIRRAPADGYWTHTWMQVPFASSAWLGRTTVDMMLSTGYASDAPWNETFWYRPEFDRLLIEARGELDFGRRQELYSALQRMIHEDGGAIVPFFGDTVDAARDTVQGFEPAPHYGLSGYRAPEKVWFQTG